YHNVGALFLDARQLDKAGAALHDAATLGDKLVRDYPQQSAYRRQLAIVHDYLGILLFENHRPQEAEKSWRTALDHYDRIGDADNVVFCRYNISVVLRAMGRVKQAGAEYTDAFKNSQDKAAAHFDVAKVLRPSRLAEAISEYREAIRLKKDYPEAHL